MKTHDTSKSHDASRIRAKAYQLGFDLVGFVPCTGPLRREYFLDWLNQRKFAGMAWLGKNAEKRFDPALLLTGASSVIVTGVSYHHEPKEGDYKLASYAFGADYHGWIKMRLSALADFIRDDIELKSLNRVFVDTGPVLERDLAAQAGLGWIGKNTCLINPEAGSYVFLGVIITTLKLQPDRQIADHCLNCRLCVDACPTGALEPYRLDPVKCLAYQNIEKRGERDREFWQAMGDQLVGCDICQEVCPFNQTAPMTRQDSWTATFKDFQLGGIADLLAFDEAEYDRRTRGSAVSRVRYADFMRNVFLVIANTGRYDLLPSVTAWGESHPDRSLAEREYCITKLKEA